MKTLKYLILILVVNGNFTTFAQTNNSIKWYSHKQDRNVKRMPWVVSLGWNNIVDDGEKWRHLLDIKNWNIPVYPSSVRLEKGFNRNLIFLLNGSYNSMKTSATGKFKSELPVKTYSQMSFDFDLRYNFLVLYDVNYNWYRYNKKTFEIYAIQGVGCSIRSIDSHNFGTFNMGGGIHANVFQGVGFFIEAMGKFALDKPLFKTGNSYKNYMLGISYTIPRKNK